MINKCGVKLQNIVSTPMGFEPTRAEPIGLAVQRLNHSATASVVIKLREIVTLQRYLRNFISE